MRYGIPYQGSKSKIADYIIDILPAGNRFIDLFGGGFAMSHCALLSGKYKKVYYNELNPLLKPLIEDCIGGKYNKNTFKPKWISREEFHELKNKDGYIKYLWSFGNGGENYLFGEEIENYKKDLHNAVVFNDFSGETFEELEFLKYIKGNNIKERKASSKKIINTYYKNK